MPEERITSQSPAASAPANDAESVYQGTKETIGATVGEELPRGWYSYVGCWAIIWLLWAIGWGVAVYFGARYFLGEPWTGWLISAYGGWRGYQAYRHCMAIRSLQMEMRAASRPAAHEEGTPRSSTGAG
jgi:hypothetical protein